MISPLQHAVLKSKFNISALMLIFGPQLLVVEMPQNMTIFSKEIRDIIRLFFDTNQTVIYCDLEINGADLKSKGFPFTRSQLWLDGPISRLYFSGNVDSVISKINNSVRYRAML